MTSANVVQSSACNVGAVSAPGPQMGLVGGEVLGMGATGSGRVPRVAADRAGLGAADTAPDMESAVLVSQCVDNEASGSPCHTLCNKRALSAAARGELGERSNRGGRGVGERGAELPTIGFEQTENFANADAHGRVLVRAVALTEAGLLSRVIATGQVVIVTVQKRMRETVLSLNLPTLLLAEKKEGGGLTLAGVAREERCPQCLLASPIDCLEQPCGWPKKKKGGAA